MKILQTPSKILSLLFLIMVSGCSPKPVINSFTVFPRTITAADTVKVNMDVKGIPTLLVHEKPSADSGVKYLELTLLVKRGAQQLSRPEQVTILPPNAATAIIFNTTLSGDTLIAEGMKSPERWGDRFAIATIAADGNRSITVEHAGKKGVLNKDGNFSRLMEGTPVGGNWKLTSLLTTEEKNGTATPPETLQINATIKYIR